MINYIIIYNIKIFFKSNNSGNYKRKVNAYFFVLFVAYTHYNMHNNVVIKNKIPDIYKNMNKLKLLRPCLHSRVLHSGYTTEAGAHLRQCRVLPGLHDDSSF